MPVPSRMHSAGSSSSCGKLSAGPCCSFSAPVPSPAPESERNLAGAAQVSDPEQRRRRRRRGQPWLQSPSPHQPQGASASLQGEPHFKKGESRFLTGDGKPGSLLLGDSMSRSLKQRTPKWPPKENTGS